MTIYTSSKYSSLLSLIILGILILVMPQATHAAVISTSPSIDNISCSTGLSCGLVGYWTLDGKDTNWTSNTTLDKSGSGNTGTLTSMSTTTSPVPGKVGQGLRFDGVDDYVQISDTANLRFNNTEPFTVSAWINARTISNAENKAILYKGNDGDPENTNYGLVLNTGNTLSFFWEYGSGTNDDLATLSTISANKWYLVTGVWNGTTKYIYLNGVQSNSSTPGGNPTIGSSRPVTIGYNLAGTSSGGFAFPGLVDDVRIYNRALSATEVQQLYNFGNFVRRSASPNSIATTSCSTGLSCGLAGYWTFDGKDTSWTSASAGTTADMSRGGKTGTLTNMSQTATPALGKIGQSFKFDGVNDSVDFSTLSFTFPLTIHMWVYPLSYGDADGRNTFFDSRSTGANGVIFFMENSPTTKAFKFATSNTNGSSEPSIASPNNTMVLNKWQQVVITVTSSGTATLYYNGSSVASNSSFNPADTFTGATTYRIGRPTTGAISAGTSLDAFPGYIDDVRIYKRALSATEVLQLYNLGAATKQAASPQVTATSCTTGLSCGLVGYWTLDGKDTNWTSNTTLDKSGSGNTGTLTSMSTTTSPVPGKVGQGLRFDGVNDYIVTSANTKLSGAAGLTVNAWFNATDFTTRNIVAQGALDTIANYIFQVRLQSSTSILFGVSDGTTQKQFTATVPSMTAGRWYFFTGIWNGASMTVYINGVQADTNSTSIPTSLNTASKSFYVGTEGRIQDFFSGLIDDVRIYNRALSTTEIKQLYNLGR